MEHKPLHKLKLKDLKKETTRVFKKLNCPACEAPIPADNMNIHDKIGKCSSCDALFPFQEEVLAFANQPTIKQEVIRPEGIDIFHFQEELDITIQQPTAWFDGFMLIMAAVFFLVLEIYFLSGKMSFSWVAIFSIFPLYVIINYLNRANHKVSLSIDERTLTIKWRPKKFTKDKTYDIHDIDQIYVNKLNGVSMIINGGDGQKHVKLLPKLSSPSKAKYLEQEIEKHLGIIDREVLEAKP
ncbi:MAG: hypothetical protein AB8G86_14725 [Saprospiraceae bacterium]